MLTDHDGNWPEWLKKAGKTIKAFFESFYADFSYGVGIGFEASADLGGIPVKTSMLYAEKNTIGIQENEFVVNNSHEFGIELSAFGVVTVGSAVKQEHSYFDEDCSCNFWDVNFVKKAACPAHEDVINNDIKIGLSAGVYWGIGADASLGFNVSYFYKELIEVFAK